MAVQYPVSAHPHWLGDYLASRGRNPDMVTINPAECKPGEVYGGTVHGAERTVLIRRDASDSYPWESLGEVLDHEDVSGLVRLVPAREVTRDDLPDFGAMASVMARWKVSYGAVSGVLDAVVAHLNANGGLPADDRWRRAHEIVEQERDQARESLREACKVAQSYKVDAYQATERAEAAECERDEALEGSALFQRDVHEWRARAEAAEARTAPAVSREQVEDELNTWSQPGMGRESLVNLVCRLFGVEAEPVDPVEDKARELYESVHDGCKWATLIASDSALDRQVRGKYRGVARLFVGQKAQR